jgi:lipopolysaccharide/colanic/teichoic acid biosynthesis glycosyltransferase
MKFKLEQAVPNSKFDSVHTVQQEQISMMQLEKRIVPSYYPYWCIFVNLIFGLSGSLILFFILPILALLIYLDSPGPIFYTQERLGYQGSIFRMYKLRTMHVETKQTGSLVRTTERDLRVTRVGRFLRITHLDELPQVLNILRGDMNLIGPRPEQPAIAAMLEQTTPLYRARLRIKPGLTGWAQVMYHYTNTQQGDAVKLKYDLYYIANRSLRLDMKIILKTIIEMLFGYGR